MSHRDAALQALLDKGVRIPNPASVDIAEDVDVDKISTLGRRFWRPARQTHRQIARTE